MIPTIYNWSTREGGGFYGQIKDHPLLVQGCWVEIHGIVAVDSKENLVDENGGQYILGDPDPMYADLYPNIRQRMLAQIAGTALGGNELMQEPGT